MENKGNQPKKQKSKKGSLFSGEGSKLRTATRGSREGEQPGQGQTRPCMAVTSLDGFKMEAKRKSHHVVFVLKGGLRKRHTQIRFNRLSFTNRKISQLGVRRRHFTFHPQDPTKLRYMKASRQISDRRPVGKMDGRRLCETTRTTRAIYVLSKQPTRTPTVDARTKSCTTLKPWETTVYCTLRFLR